MTQGRVYTGRIYVEPLMPIAKVFRSGNSQAVRLPKEFRFGTAQVEIFRRGDEVVLRELGRGVD
jgi:antitoxin VapB